MERTPARFKHPAAVCFLIGVALWVAVDWGTAGGYRPGYLATYMPALLIFYLGYPAILTWLVFRRSATTRGLVAATVVGIFIVEVLFVHNPWLIVPPLMFVGIPLALAIYSPLTFFPVWIVRGEMGRHRLLVRFLIAVEVAITALTVLGSGG